MPNIYEPAFEPDERPAGFKARRARIGYDLGTELIGCSLWELPPGEAAYPYHFHYADEELILVLRGRPTLRTPQGTRERARARRWASRSARRARCGNDTDEDVTFVAISSSGRPDVVVYPDSNKIGVGSPPRGGGLREFFRREGAVDYWDREG